MNLTNSPKRFFKSGFLYLTTNIKCNMIKYLQWDLVSYFMLTIHFYTVVYTVYEKNAEVQLPA